jgi:hypothetical protein
MHIYLLLIDRRKKVLLEGLADKLPHRVAANKNTHWEITLAMLIA